MSNSKYTEKEIEWAINELKKKHPERANREQAIKFLDTFGRLGGIIAKTLITDKKSGRLKQKMKN